MRRAIKAVLRREGWRGLYSGVGAVALGAGCVISCAAMVTVWPSGCPQSMHDVRASMTADAIKRICQGQGLLLSSLACCVSVVEGSWDCARTWAQRSLQCGAQCMSSESPHRACCT